jgi:hypothetical protein
MFYVIETKKDSLTGIASVPWQKGQTVHKFDELGTAITFIERMVNSQLDSVFSTRHCEYELIEGKEIILNQDVETEVVIEEVTKTKQIFSVREEG